MATTTDRKLSQTTEISILTGQENIPFFKGLMNGFFPLSLIKTYITKKDVGLEFADNTSDLNKPISILQQEALDNKADRTHNHSSQDITDFTTAVNTIVNPKLDLKSDKGHTHLSEDVTDLTIAINNNVDPKLDNKADRDHTHDDLGGNIELPEAGLLKVGSPADTFASAIPSIDYVDRDNITFFNKPQVPSARIMQSIYDEFADDIANLNLIHVKWDILKHQVLYIPADFYVDKIEIYFPPESFDSIIDNANLSLTNWKKLIGTQYQVIIVAPSPGATYYLEWDAERFLWPNGQPYTVDTNSSFPNLIILNFELVALPTIISDETTSALEFGVKYTTTETFNYYLAFLGAVENLMPDANPNPGGGGGPY